MEPLQSTLRRTTVRRLLLTLVAVGVLAGCSDESGVSAKSSCGRDYVVASTGGVHLPLAGCDAAVGGEPLQTITVKVGSTIRLSKSDGTELVVTSSSAGVASVERLTIRARAVGVTTITMERGAFCSPPVPPATGPQPKRCPLLRVDVRR
jgi:hypothetical protein